MSFRASAPGSMMLLGEYGVLHGQPALVAAIDKRIHVTLTPRPDQRIEIVTPQHALSTCLTTLTIQSPFHFVLATLRSLQKKLPSGCDLHITSEFSDQVGLGSSAAVTVATLAAVYQWLKMPIDLIKLVQHGRAIIRHVQGVGSGADIAASVYGGMVAYRSQPVRIEKLSASYPLTVLYAGFKTPTPVAIKKVQEYFSAAPQVLRKLYQAIGATAQQGIDFVQQQNRSRLGEMFSLQQGLMTSLGVNTPLLQDMVDDLKKHSQIVGAKISGSGLGDCVIGLGDVPLSYLPSQGQRILVNMSAQGVQCEES
jgi:mevalonate kinase